IGDRSLKPIWNFYNRGKLIDKSDYYEAKCQVYNRLFLPGKLAQMEKYIIDKYTKVSKKIKEAIIYIVESYKSNITRTKSSTKQLSLNEFLESTTILNKYIESINRALIKAF
ncbi:41905_t:CDS:1, partial [Gigaspora margarita]